MAKRVATAGVLILLVTGLAVAQRGRLGDFGLPLSGVTPGENLPYDGRFAFVRLTYQTLPGGYWYRGQPAWSHGYPTSEEHLMQILGTLTSVPAHERTNTLSLEDPEIFKYPVLYIIEVSWGQMTDAEATNLRAFLDKGGFVIVDDCKTAEWRGGRGWDQFADNMQRVVPAGRFLALLATRAGAPGNKAAVERCSSRPMAGRRWLTPPTRNYRASTRPLGEASRDRTSWPRVSRCAAP